jgi:hypothetical protein
LPEGFLIGDMVQRGDPIALVRHLRSAVTGALPNNHGVTVWRHRHS